MTISFVNLSTKAVGSTTVVVNYPATPAAGNMFLAVRNAYSDGTMTCADEGGWTSCGDRAGGTGVTTDNHQTKIRGDYKQATGSESGSVTFDQTFTGGGASTIATMLQYTKDAAATWDIAFANGDDNSHGANRSVTTSTSVSMAPGDWLVAEVATDTDTDLAGPPTATFSATGITFGTPVRRTSGAGTTQGLDANVEVWDVPVTSGTATGAVTFTMTTSTNQCGPVNIVRLREVFAAPTADASIAATTPRPTVAISADSDPTADASLAATTPRPTVAVSLEAEDATAEVAAATPRPVVAAILDSTESDTLTLAATTPRPVVAVDVDSDPAGDLTLAVTTPRPTVAVDLDAAFDAEVTVTASTPRPVVDVQAVSGDGFTCIDLAAAAVPLFDSGEVVDGEFVPGTAQPTFIISDPILIGEATTRTIRLGLDGGDIPDGTVTLYATTSPDPVVAADEYGNWRLAVVSGSLGASVEVTIGPGVEDYDDAYAAGAIYLIVEGPFETTVTEVCYTGDPVVIPPTLTLRGRAGGRRRRAVSQVTWEPPVAPVPPHLTQNPALWLTPKATGYTSVTMDGTQPVLNDYWAVDGVPTRQRVLIGNTDVTFWRGVPTVVEYEYVSPGLFGPARVTFHQIASAEPLGVGDLFWLYDFAEVIVQRVTEDDVVVAEPWRGLITRWGSKKGRRTAILGGELVGRAAMAESQPPLYGGQRSLEQMAFRAVRDTGLRFEPRRGAGINTGIQVERFGGGGMLEHINKIMARGQVTDGAPWTLLPLAGRRKVYTMVRKDVETIHATAYFDDTRTVSGLIRDLSTEPNRVYAELVEPDGRRIRYGTYPGIVPNYTTGISLPTGFASTPTTPAPYPFNDNSSFGVGTTDGDTDTGDGVSVMIARLQTVGLLRRNAVTGDFDAAVSRAIGALQIKAGLAYDDYDYDDDTKGPRDDTDWALPSLALAQMNPRTWEALFDVGVTGSSELWAHIEPAAQRDYMRRWDRASSGAIIRKNPGYRYGHPRVDEKINLGAGFTRQDGRRFSRLRLRESSLPNWVGPLTFNTFGLIRGEHNPGDGPVAPEDVMGTWELQPGMNIWCPLEAGGILVHIAGGGDRPNGGGPQFAADTRARDTVPVWEVMAADRETRDEPTRDYVRRARQSNKDNDAVQEFSEIGGRVYMPVEVPGGQWVVFKVYAGQAGTIREVMLRTIPARAGVMCLFQRKISPLRLDRLIGDPTTVEGWERWADEDIIDKLEDRNGPFVVWGQPTERIGYTPGRESRGDPLTGRFRMRVSVDYTTGDNRALYLAVFMEDDCTIPVMDVLHPHIDPGV